MGHADGVTVGAADPIDVGRVPANEHGRAVDEACPAQVMVLNFDRPLWNYERCGLVLRGPAGSEP